MNCPMCETPLVVTRRPTPDQPYTNWMCPGCSAGLGMAGPRSNRAPGSAYAGPPGREVLIAIANMLDHLPERLHERLRAQPVVWDAMLKFVNKLGKKAPGEELRRMEDEFRILLMRQLLVLAETEVGK